MADSTSNSVELLAQELINMGEKLNQLPSSTDELLNLIDSAERILYMVGQSPPTSLRDAIEPLIKALVRDNLLRHMNADVKVSITCCIAEITRITAPESPYGDKEMEEYFQLAVMSFENLSSVSGRLYTKAVIILETFAKFRSCLIMLDLELDALVIQMFKVFLRTISSDHPDNVFSCMEKTMTLIIQYSEEVSSELLGVLLTSVAKYNHSVAPIAWKLGVEVFKNCTEKLKPYLPLAVRAMGIAFDDYAEIVASICQDEPKREDKIIQEKPGKEDKLRQKEPEREDNICQEEPQKEEKAHKHKPGSERRVSQDKPRREDEVCQDKPVMELKIRQGESGSEDKEPQEAAAGSVSSDKDTPPVNGRSQLAMHGGSDPTIKSCILKDKTFQLDPQMIPRKRGRKPNSLVKPEEGYDPSWICGGRVALDTFYHRKDYKRTARKRLASTDCALPLGPEEEIPSPILFSKAVQSEILCDTTFQNHSVPGGIPGRRGYLKLKAVLKNQVNGLDLLPVKGDTPGIPFGEKGSQFAAASTRKESAGEKQKRVLKKWMYSLTTDEVHNVAEGIQDSSVKKIDANNQSWSQPTSNKHLNEESADKETDSISAINILNAGDSQGDRTLKAKCKRKSTPSKRETSATINAGEKLVGCKVKVWWPRDKTFYMGHIMSFDHSRKRHKVIYDDGDEEVLDLMRERWELIGDGNILDQGGDVKASGNMYINDVSVSHGPAGKNRKAMNDQRTPGRKSWKLDTCISKQDGGHSADPISHASSQMCPSIKRNKTVPRISHDKKREKPLMVILPIEDTSQSTSPDASAANGMVDVHGYKVKPTIAPTLTAIIAKYGDIAANCLYKSPSVRSSLLEIVCNVVQRLKKNDPAAIYDLQAIDNEVSDAEAAKLDVPWLREYLWTIRQVEKIDQESCLLKKAKIGAILNTKAAVKDLKDRQAKLLEAQERVVKARKCVEALKVLAQKFNRDILECEAQKSTVKARLDELL